MTRPTLITIDTAALRHNLARVKQLAPDSAVLAMVKANGYGHGLLTVAKALQDADGFGVASIDEGLVLREAGIKQPIFLMEGLFSPDELTLAALHHFTLVIHHEPQVEMLQSVKLKSPLTVWLKVNTGMNRLGLSPERFHACYQTLMASPVVAKPIGVMTHFAEADNLESGASVKQLETFMPLVEGLDSPMSLCNSAGILSLPMAHADWVRPGLMLYGASPFAGETGVDRGLKPVMTFSSQLIAIQSVAKGQKVGYGGTWTAKSDTRIGIVAAGYGDGYPQQAKNGTPVRVNDQLCSLVGRVSMDMLAIDLKSNMGVAIGDPITLWGEGLPVEMVAKHCNTSPYELLTSMTARPRAKQK